MYFLWRRPPNSPLNYHWKLRELFLRWSCKYYSLENLTVNGLRAGEGKNWREQNEISNGNVVFAGRIGRTLHIALQFLFSQARKDTRITICRPRCPHVVEASYIYIFETHTTTKKLRIELFVQTTTFSSLNDRLCCPTIFLDCLCPPHAVFTVQLYYTYNQYCAHFANWFSLKKLFERVLKLNLKASGSPYVILMLCLDVSCLPREVTLWRGALVIATSCVYYIWSPTNGVNRDVLIAIPICLHTE